MLDPAILFPIFHPVPHESTYTIASSPLFKLSPSLDNACRWPALGVFLHSNCYLDLSLIVIIQKKPVKPCTTIRGTVVSTRASDTVRHTKIHSSDPT